ncbi:MAG: hydroxymethylglutaryl-CoA lyase [Bacteriovoracaceae bacterium]
MFKNLPKQVKMVEVGPRDGLQNEKSFIETQDKFTYIEKLIQAGLTHIEVGSFVNPDKILQMKDTVELYKLLDAKFGKSGLNLICLVPNLTGLKSALSVNVKSIAVFTSTSNEFNKKNINATIDESLVRITEVMKIAKTENLQVRGYVSTVFGCPYEGKTSVEELKRVLDKLFNLGVYEVSLGDTIGVATPAQVETIILELKKSFDVNKLALHFHDTLGMAVSNILVGLENGVTIFDSSSGGLGGCPYAKGATGNVTTEDVWYLLNSFNIDTKINLDKLMEASNFILSKVNKETPSKFLQYKNKSGKKS